MNYNLDEEEQLYRGPDGEESKKIKFKGKKNPNNPREMLNKANKVYISKKANYNDCATCNICVSENVYKIYKYKSKNQRREEEEE